MSGFNFKSMNASMSDARMENFKKNYGGGGGDFKFVPIYWSAMSDGAYKVRLGPKSPSRNPQGAVRIATHKVELRLAEKPQEVTCLYKPGVEGADCYVCDLLEAVQEELSSFSKDVVHALEEAAPRVLWLFPAIITAKRDPSFTPSEGKKHAPWVPDENARQGAILQLEGKRVLTALFDILREYPDANDLDEGYWLTITKMGKETPMIRAARNASELNAAERDLFGDKDYPSLYPIPKFMSKSLRDLDYEGQKTLVSQSWWAKDVISDEEDITF